MTANTAERVILSDHREWTSSKKIITCTLLWGEFKHQYQVLAISDTTWYYPGTWLSTEIVSQLCAREDWKVSMIHDDLVKNILTGIASHISLPTVAVPTSL